MTERITSYGYIVKNSGDTVLTTSIKMAFRLFESRKLAADTFDKEKEQLRVTLQSVGDAVVATDAQGRVTLLNPVAEHLTGYSTQAAAGRPLSEVFRIFNSRTREPMENPVGRVLAEGRVVGLANHTVLVSANGDEYQIADSAAPIRDSTGEIIGVVLVFRDVTKEYAAQEELRQRERDMRQAQELANLGSWRLNLGNGTVDASPTAHRIYGLPEGGLTMQQIQSVPLATCREMLDAALYNLVHHGLPYDVEFEIHRLNDGETRHIHSVAEYDADQNVVVGTLHDITEQKRIEETLREERAHYSTITEMSPIGIATVDPNGVITYANSAAERILGLQRDQITSRTYDAPEWEHTAPEGGPFPDEDQPFSIVKRTLKPTYDVRHGITWPDGRHIELSINASPVLTEKGGFGGMVATFEDITERKEAEDHIRALLREKELLLRESHHRVMNNMNTINSLLSMQSESTESPLACDALNDAANRLQAMARVYDKLFRNTRTGPMSIREFLIPLINEAVEVFSSVTPVRVSAEVEDFLIDSGTLTSLGIVINELITNSVKHAFSGKKEGQVSVTAGRKGSQIIVTYRDNGPGLEHDTATGETPGFGMQLVQMTIEGLDGRMRIQPGPGFRIELMLPNT